MARAPYGPALEIHRGDNALVLARLAAQSFDLIYVDPPFNTGKVQSRTTVSSVRDARGDQRGFGGERYRTIPRGRKAYPDRFEDYLAFLAPRLAQAHRLLKPAGSLFVHLDCREVHYVKVLLDELFGRESFQNEIVWAYDYGARTKQRWPKKHDNILWYAKDPKRFTFRYEAVDRVPYMAPGLVGAKKAARGKTPTDTWWMTIVSPTGREKTGYPTQKPLKLVQRIVEVHSQPGDRLLDFFAGSGTLGEAAARAGRSAVLIDRSAAAVAVMAKRLAFARPRLVDWTKRAR